jgi:Rad52/22 family double-strand break repair protein
VSTEMFPLATLSEALRHLRRPVPPEAVHFKVQSEGRSGGLIVGYIDSRTVSERLNLVVGERWSCEFRALEGSLLPIPAWAEDGKPPALPVYAVCRLSVCGVTREDVGEGATPKGAFSDALKRAAVAFGIGRFLYAMKSPWLDAGDGEHELRRGRGAKPRLIIDRRTEAWLRERYAEWLARVAEEFGEPLGHGDEVGAPGLEEDPGKDRDQEVTDADGSASRPKRTPKRPRPAPAGAGTAAGMPAEAPGRRELAHWQRKGRYGDETVRSLATVVCSESALEALNAQQLGELAFLVECAVRGRVSGRSLDSWLAQLAHRDDRRTAAEALRARLVEKTNEVELDGRREAA